MVPQLAPEDQAIRDDVNANAKDSSGPGGGQGPGSGNQGLGDASGFGLPGDYELWSIDGQFFLVWFVPDLQPPVPMAWSISAEELSVAGIAATAKRTMSSQQFAASGGLSMGDRLELANTSEHPFELFANTYSKEAEIRPWLRDPEVMAITAGALLEGRPVTDAELQTTNWWRTHNEEERAWLSLSASDPAAAKRHIEDQTLIAAELLRNAGIDDAPQSLVTLIAGKVTTGQWSALYASDQIRLLADPYLSGELDEELDRGGLETTRDREQFVKDEVTRWLGPLYGNWGQSQIAQWAGKLRNNANGDIEFQEMLSAQRLALFPAYENPTLTYDDIASPWRNVWSSILGEVPDEMDSFFPRIVNMNDAVSANTALRKHGLDTHNPQVANSVADGMLAAFGNNIRRPNPGVL